MKEITLEATIENIPQVAAWIDAELEAVDCPIKAQMQIDLAIDEMFGNIAHYAYAPDTGSATVRFAYDAASGMAEITFVDRGKPYDPLAKQDPDVTLSADERAVGGLGIFLVKKTMDDMTYRYENGENHLTIRKKIG